jgi:hypothetical protein
MQQQNPRQSPPQVQPNKPKIFDVNLLDLPADRAHLAQLLAGDFLATLPKMPKPSPKEVASRLEEFLIRKATEIGVRILYWDRALAVIDDWPITPEGVKKWNRFSDAIRSSMDTKTRKAPPEAAAWLAQAARDLRFVRRTLLKTKAAELADLPTLRMNLMRILMTTSPESIPALCRNVDALDQFIERNPEHFGRWIKGHINDTEMARRCGAAQHHYGAPDSFRQAASRAQTKANRKRNDRARIKKRDVLPAAVPKGKHSSDK